MENKISWKSKVYNLITKSVSIDIDKLSKTYNLKCSQKSSSITFNSKTILINIR